MSAAWMSISVAKLAPSLCKAQKAMKNAIKDASNPHFKSSYATLVSVLEAVKPALEANGLALLQHPSGTGEYAGLTTTLLHESGEFMQWEMTLAAGNAGPQDYVSSVTYARRTAVLAVCWIAADDDDDGEAAQLQRPAPQASSTPTQKPRPAAKGSDHVFPPFGRSKGMPVEGASLGDLKFYRDAALRSLADQSKKLWHAKEQNALAAYEAELLRAHGWTLDESGQLQDPDAPPF